MPASPGSGGFGSGGSAADPVGSVQRTYLQSVHDRFKEEAGRHAQRTLIVILKENEWWKMSGGCARCRRPRSAP